jgi:4-amino-4-deoxy-L-arabinose transferase-like glycosyltransferase
MKQAIIKLKNYSRNKYIFSILVIFTILAGVLLRVQETVTNNFLFLIDQGRDMIAVKNIVFNHHLTLIGPYTSLGGVFQGPIWYYLLSVPTFILNGNPLGAEILMLIISISAMLLAFYFMYKLFGKKAAIITLFLFAVSPEAAAAATYIWNPHPMWLLIILYIFSLFFAIQGKKKWYIVVWLTLGLMFNFEAALAVFILLSFIIYIVIFERKAITNKLFLSGLILFVLLFIPQILFELRHNFLMTRSVLDTFLGQNHGLFVKGENKGYLDLVLSHLQTFYNNFNSAFVKLNYFNFLQVLFLLIFVGVSIFYKKIKFFSQKEKIFISLVFKSILLVFILSFFYPFPIRYWFLTGFQGFYIVFIGLILSKFIDKSLGKILLIILLILVSFQTLERIKEIYSSKDQGGVSKIKGKLEALDYIYKDANGKKFGLKIFTPPVYTYAYDYLLWWYGERKYNYLPYQEKKGITYLLIEPDPNQQWSYKGWLETVIKNGTILKTVDLPSGFIIQKRSYLVNEK